MPCVKKKVRTGSIAENDINADYADINIGSCRGWRKQGRDSTGFILKMDTTYIDMEPEQLFDLINDYEQRIKWDVKRFIDPKILGKNMDGFQCFICHLSHQYQLLLRENYVLKSIHCVTTQRRGNI